MVNTTIQQERKKSHWVTTWYNGDLPDLLEADMRLVSLTDPLPERAEVGGLSLEGGDGCLISGTEGGAKPPWSWSTSVN